MFISILELCHLPCIIWFRVREVDVQIILVSVQVSILGLLEMSSGLCNSHISLVFSRLLNEHLNAHCCTKHPSQ